MSTKSRIRRFLMLVALAATAVASSQSTSANETQPEGSLPPGFVRLLLLVDTSGSPQASFLQAVDWLRDRHIERSLIITPQGEHLVVTQQELPLIGRRIIRIQHEETGWYAQLEERTGMTFDRVEQIASPTAVVDEFLRGEKPRTTRLEATSLTEAVQFSSTTWDDYFLDGFYRALAAQDGAARLAEGMSPRTETAVAFLHALTRCGSCALSLGRGDMLVDLLGQSIAEYGTGSADLEHPLASWTSERVEVARDVSEQYPRIVRFISEFRSVPPLDPLADLRPSRSEEPAGDQDPW